MAVMLTEMSSDLRQPVRFDKKKNTGSLPSEREQGDLSVVARSPRFRVAIGRSFLCTARGSPPWRCHGSACRPPTPR
jgi:hypothetical protein